MVESPSWLIRREKFEKGLNILKEKYGKDNSVPIAVEIRYNLEVKEKRVETDSYKTLFKPSKVTNLIAIYMLSLLKASSGFFVISLFFPILLSKFDVSLAEQLLSLSVLAFIPEMFAITGAIKFVRKSHRNVVLAIASILACTFLLIMGLIRNFPFNSDLYFFLPAIIGYRCSNAIMNLILNEMIIDMVPEECPAFSLTFAASIETGLQILFIFCYSFFSADFISDIAIWVMALFCGLSFGISNFWQSEKGDLKQLLLIRESHSETGSIKEI